MSEVCVSMLMHSYGQKLLCNLHNLFHVLKLMHAEIFDVEPYWLMAD